MSKALLKQKINNLENRVHDKKLTKDVDVPDMYIEIFEKQKEFTGKMLTQWQGKPFNCYNFTKQEFDLFYSIDNAIEELGEARRLLNRKAWKNAKITIDRKKILEELIDAEKFINQCKLLLGFDVVDSYMCHMKKDKKNHARQKRGY